MLDDAMERHLTLQNVRWWTSGIKRSIALLMMRFSILPTSSKFIHAACKRLHFYSTPSFATESSVLQNLTYNPRCLPVGSQQLLAFLSFLLDSVVFVQEVTEEVFFVELTNKTILHFVSRVVDQEVHDRLRHLVSDGFTDDVKI